MAEYIEREALCKRINELADGAKDHALRLSDSDTDKIRYVGIWGGLCDALYVGRSLIAADVAPVRHGRWVDVGSGYVACSECGEEHGWEDYCASYCEDCGSKMDKEDPANESTSNDL